MTDQEPTQEELQKFWEWCGFKKHKIDGEIWRYDRCKETNSWWTSQDGRRWVGLPVLDLNNLFKDAVPKTAQQIAKDFHMEEAEAEHYLLHMWDKYRRHNLSWEVALLKAIQEAIK